MTASFSFSFPVVSIVSVVHRDVGLTHDVHNDAREQLALLVLVRAFLETRLDLRDAYKRFLMPSYHFGDSTVLQLIVRVGAVWWGG